MTDDHPARIAVLETEMATVKNNTREIKATQVEHGKALSEIKEHLAAQSGAAKIGIKALAVAGTVTLAIGGFFAKKYLG